MGTRGDITTSTRYQSPGALSSRPHLPVPSAGPLGHEALLTMARRVRAAAADHDPERLEQASRRFVEALDRHLETEAVWLTRAVPGEARILRKGQERVRCAAVDLLADAGRGCPTPYLDCGTRAEELLALLSLQARDEHHAHIPTPLT